MRHLPVLSLLLGCVLLLAMPACTSRLDTHDMGVSVAPLVRHSAEASGLDVGITVSGPEIELALDPLTGLADLLHGRPDEATAATDEATDLVAQLESRISSELAKGAEADQAKLAELTAAVTALREGLAEQAGQPAEPLKVEPPPIGGGPVAWVLWGIASVVGVVAWLKGRKALGATLARAIRAAEALLAQYDQAPLSPAAKAQVEEVAKGVVTKPVV